MGGFFRSWSGSSNDIERVLSIAATSQGITSNNQRRTDAWSHELKLVGYELEQNKTRKKAAEFRRDIQIKFREIHEKSIVQTEEIYTFYVNKFSNFGLYTWFSSNLQRLYREAYNSAYSMAKLAEQSFRFERDEESDLISGSGYWDPAFSGLLSGEQLLLALETLEKRYIETNYRRLEIDQAFSLALLDPGQLGALQEKGECEFVLPEFAYDLFYPGHYRRKIKAVRVTLPCVTGPYTNVSATLRLIASKVRTTPTMDNEALVSVPPQRTVSIAMSSGNNDAGVFELNFHDERYMPFEGAGAISTWKLTLPQSIPPFDYQTITDVVMRISYTAQEDESLRQEVDGLKGQIESSLIQYLSKNAMRRVFSLRDEFAKEFVKLTASPPGTAVMVVIPPLHFPFFLRSAKIATIKVEKAIIAVRAGQENGISDLSIQINNTVFDGFQQGSDLFSDIRNNYPSEAETDKRNFYFTKSESEKSEMDKRKGDDLWISNAQTPIDWVVEDEGGFALSLTFTLNHGAAQVSPEKDSKEAGLDATSIQDILLCIEYTISS